MTKESSNLLLTFPNSWCRVESSRGIAVSTVYLVFCYPTKNERQRDEQRAREARQVNVPKMNAADKIAARLCVCVCVALT